MWLYEGLCIYYDIIYRADMQNQTTMAFMNFPEIKSKCYCKIVFSSFFLFFIALLLLSLIAKLPN